MSLTELGSVEYVGGIEDEEEKWVLREAETTLVALLQNPGTSVFMLCV
jgi:hypothetical protein